MQLDEILDYKKMPKNLNRLIMTCADPNYPVSSMGDEFSAIEVSYDSEHIQQVGKGYKQLPLLYDKIDKWMMLEKELIHEALPLGVAQLAWNKERGVIVVGATGDAYTCHPEGTGFGFGTRNAPPHMMLELLGTLLTYGQKGSSNFQDVAIMAHPDCLAFAAGPGVSSIKVSAFASALSQNPEEYLGSKYQLTEREQKHQGFEAIKDMGYALGVNRVRKIVPLYLPNRLPGTHRLSH
jgi:hypothetical protein